MENATSFCTSINIQGHLDASKGHCDISPPSKSPGFVTSSRILYEGEFSIIAIAVIVYNFAPKCTFQLKVLLYEGFGAEMVQLGNKY